MRVGFDSPEVVYIVHSGIVHVRRSCLVKWAAASAARLNPHTDAVAPNIRAWCCHKVGPCGVNNRVKPCQGSAMGNWQ